MTKLSERYRNTFYKSKRWLRVRDAYRAAQHFICERCGSAGEIVHHRIYLSDENITNPTIAFDFENLELLCQTCHNKEHFKKEFQVDDGYEFDEHGQLICMIPPVGANAHGV